MAERESINNRVRIHEVCKVGPAPASDSKTTTAFTLSLTYFDTYWFYFPPVENLFFYQVTDSRCDIDSFNSLILPNLKHSLSLTLLHYLPVAGHLMWPLDAAKPAIYYFPNDSTVSVTVADSNADFNLLCQAVDFHPLVPQLSISDDKAEVIAIQITLFPNQGFSIGISVHHSLLDGKSLMLFVKSWAYLCKQLDQDQTPSLLPQLTPCFDRTLIKDPNGIDMVYVKHLMAFTGSNPRSLKVMPVPELGSNLIRRTFKLNREDINKLRDKVLSMVDMEMKQSKQFHLSTFVLTCAHVFVCLVKAKGEDANTTVMFWLPADCRSRLDPPLPLNYFGNCVTAEPVAAKASYFIEENGVAFVAEKLSDVIRGLKKDTIEGSEDKIVRELEMMKEIGEQSMITVAGTNQIDFYSSDFGWGKPKKVELVSIDRTGAISLMESRDGSCVEVGVVLHKQEMEVFASLFFNGLSDISHRLTTIIRPKL